MQKLSGISSGQNNKSCRIFHHEPKKLVLHFSDFSTIFYAIYKNLPNHKYYLSYPFAVRPSERSLVSQCGPWARAAAVRRQFRPGITGVRPGDGRGVAYGPLGVDLRLGWRRTAGRQGCPAAGPCGARPERLLRLEGRLREGYGRRGSSWRVCGGEESTDFAGAAQD
jgi:hypothetical protein